ncbi:hypothetical protein ONZ45_g17481 [Pleurotus djamor]|nr:hypothetical protein ONZ45_g17481 [Pleurotus djamor]
MAATTYTIHFSAHVQDIRRKIAKAPGTVHAVDFFKIPSRPASRKTLREAENDFENDDVFILDDEKWRKLQLYVKSSQRLPTTRQALAVNYGDSVFEALTETVASTLLDVYSTVSGNCSGFQTDYYQVVSLANDVVSYAKDTQTYYPEISRLFDIIINGTDETAQQQAATNLRSIFSGLSDRTESRATKVKTVHTFISNFKKDTDYDQGQVKAISDRVADEDSTISKEIERINTDITKKKEDLEDFTADYEAALRKGKNTAAYIWIPIAGWIAGPIVSAQASAEARAAWKEMQRLNGELDQLDRALGHAQRLKLSVSSFSADSDNVISKMSDALVTLGIMSSAWLAMSDTFSELIEKLAYWQEHLDYFAQLDFNAEKVKWEDIRKIAQQYVERAFILTTDASRIAPIEE